MTARQDKPIDSRIRDELAKDKNLAHWLFYGGPRPNSQNLVQPIKRKPEPEDEPNVARKAG